MKHEQIYGEFGILDENAVGSMKSMLTKDGIKLMKEKHEKANLENLVRLFSYYLMSNQELRTHNTTLRVLDWVFDTFCGNCVNFIVCISGQI